MVAATYNFPEIQRGDDFLEFPIARFNVQNEDETEGAAISVVSAVLEVRAQNGELVVAWSGNTMIISDNQVSLAARDDTETANWVPGPHTYKLRATTSAGKFMYLTGKFTILP
jgi:hypothetical protein